jgi:hypothetical protein
MRRKPLPVYVEIVDNCFVRIAYEWNEEWVFILGEENEEEENELKD